jgi:predicted enzyme related to lactoylglutathione lyase
MKTDDLEASKAKIKEKGGTILLESYEIPTVGTMATFKDPTGNMLALLEPAPDAEM